jgi:hypothetical protein
VHVPAYNLPESPLLGTDARIVLKNERRREKEQASAALDNAGKLGPLESI